MCYCLLRLFSFTVVLFSSNSVADPIKCPQCSQNSPCVTVLEFKEVKYAHDVFCWIDKDGSEHWDSDDGSKLQLFYYYEGDKNGTNGNNEVEL